MNYLVFCLWIIVEILSNRCTTAYPYCNINNRSMSCSSVDKDFNIEDINEINVTNSHIPKLDSTFFDTYPSLKKVVLNNVHLRHIKNNTFSQLKSLKLLNLKNNNLEGFDPAAFPPDNVLEELNLSDNNLQNVSFLNTRHFKYLKFLDVSNNNIQFLPEGMLDRFQTEPYFRILVDGNPLNCSHSGWADSLHKDLVGLLCTQKSAIKCTQDKKRKGLLSYNTASEVQDEDFRKCTMNSCFTQCLFWFFGAIWIGIIIGNVCKIRRLIFMDTRLEDKNTQYDTADLVQKPPATLSHEQHESRNTEPR